MAEEPHTLPPWEFGEQERQRRRFCAGRSQRTRLRCRRHRDSSVSGKSAGVRSAPLGYVLSRLELGGIVYHSYAYGQDDTGGRPWLRREGSLNSAVAWMIQHEAELSALTGRLRPEPDEWPS